MGEAGGGGLTADLNATSHDQVELLIHLKATLFHLDQQVSHQGVINTMGDLEDFKSLVDRSVNTLLVLFQINSANAVLMKKIGIVSFWVKCCDGPKTRYTPSQVNFFFPDFFFFNATSNCDVKV